MKNPYSVLFLQIHTTLNNLLLLACQELWAAVCSCPLEIQSSAHGFVFVQDRTSLCSPGSLVFALELWGSFCLRPWCWNSRHEPRHPVPLHCPALLGDVAIVYFLCTWEERQTAAAKLLSQRTPHSVREWCRFCHFPKTPVFCHQALLVWTHPFSEPVFPSALWHILYFLVSWSKVQAGKVLCVQPMFLPSLSSRCLQVT